MATYSRRQVGGLTAATLSTQLNPYPMTVDPRLYSGATAVNANQIMYLKIRGSGTITKIGLHIGTSSGNVRVGAYSNTGSGRNARPGARVADSGSVVCPATGYQEISLGSTVTVADGDWFAIVADNATATFGRSNAGGFSSTLANGLSHHENAAALPATATPLSGAVFSVILVGVA